jgi:hypothetical protein
MKLNKEPRMKIPSNINSTMEGKTAEKNFWQFGDYESVLPKKKWNARDTKKEEVPEEEYSPPSDLRKQIQSLNELVKNQNVILFSESNNSTVRKPNMEFDVQHKQTALSGGNKSNEVRDVLDNSTFNDDTESEERDTCNQEDEGEYTNDESDNSEKKCRLGPDLINSIQSLNKLVKNQNAILSSESKNSMVHIQHKQTALSGGNKTNEVRDVLDDSTFNDDIEIEERSTCDEENEGEYNNDESDNSEKKYRLGPNLTNSESHDYSEKAKKEGSSEEESPLPDVRKALEKYRHTKALKQKEKENMSSDTLQSKIAKMRERFACTQDKKTEKAESEDRAKSLFTLTNQKAANTVNSQPQIPIVKKKEAQKTVKRKNFISKRERETITDHKTLQCQTPTIESCLVSKGKRYKQKLKVQWDTRLRANSIKSIEDDQDPDPEDSQIWDAFDTLIFNLDTVCFGNSKADDISEGKSSTGSSNKRTIVDEWMERTTCCAEHPSISGCLERSDRIHEGRIIMASNLTSSRKRDFSPPALSVDFVPQQKTEGMHDNVGRWIAKTTCNNAKLPKLPFSPKKDSGIRPFRKSKKSYISQFDRSQLNRIPQDPPSSSLCMPIKVPFFETNPNKIPEPFSGAKINKMGAVDPPSSNVCTKSQSISFETNSLREVRATRNIDPLSTAEINELSLDTSTKVVASKKIKPLSTSFTNGEIAAEKKELTKLKIGKRINHLREKLLLDLLPAADLKPEEKALIMEISVKDYKETSRCYDLIYEHTRARIRRSMKRMNNGEIKDPDLISKLIVLGKRKYQKNPLKILKMCQLSKSKVSTID